MNLNAISSSFYRETFPVGPLQCNCTLIGDTNTKKGLVVDPGGDADLIMDRIYKLGWTIQAIIHTHAHFDHILAAGVIREKTGAPILLHKSDQFLWDLLETQCKMFGVPYSTVPNPDRYLKDDEDLGCCCGVALHTPGHTPGSLSFWFEQDKILIAGDTLFHRAIGRTDLWGGDFPTIEKSIKERLYTLDEHATVITGHGPETILGEEKALNPFIKG